MPYNSIHDIVTALQSIVTHCKQNNTKDGFFAALYTRMTIAVRDGMSLGAFEDAKRMEQLDICFAERYIAAWTCFGKKQACSQSWQYAFTSSLNDNNIVLQHLLLGINTHINLDLAIAAATIAPGDKIYALEKDFNRINDVIAALIDDVQECLSRVWLPMRVIAKVVNRRHEAVLNFSIEKARQTAWANAVLLAGMNEVQQQQHIKAMDNLVTQVATRIQHPGGWLSFLLKIIRKTEFNNPARTIGLIESVVVT